MRPLQGALAAELLKVRRTLAALLAVLGPAVVVLLRSIEWWHRGAPPDVPSGELWERYALSCMVLWSMLVMPFLAALEASLLVDLEQRSGGWKHLFTLPLPRWKPLAAKALVLHALVAASHVLLVAWIVGIGSALSGLSAGVTLTVPVPWAFLWRTAALTSLAGLLLTSLHFWISLRTRSVVGALAVALAAIFLGLVVSSSAFGRIYPWSLPVNVVFGTGERTLSAVLISLGGGAAATLAAILDFARSEAPE